MLLPKDFDPQKSYPAILDIHGGPKTVYGEVFYHEMQYWASQGWFVFFTNTGRRRPGQPVCRPAGKIRHH